MTAYSFEWRHYSRSFRQPLQTHYGKWAIREGILVRLQDDDSRVGWGEIAPISWFGSETVEQAIDYCQSLNGQITAEQIVEIPDRLPACQFGLESALESLRSESVRSSQKTSLSYSVLLSAEDVLEAERRSNQCDRLYSPLNPPLVGDFDVERERQRLGFTQNWVQEGRQWGASQSAKDVSSALSEQSLASRETFKCKIGVQEIDREIDQIDRLLRVLPAGAKLRLDANGGLSETETCRWLEWCDACASICSPTDPQIEFIEQPLPPNRFLQMQRLSQQFQTPIALDESVATIDQLQDCFVQGWRGIVVIKPAIAGSPARLRRFCREHQPDVVWSSALETGIGRRYIEDNLIPATGLTQRAIGFGVDQWFANDWGQRSAESLWQEFAEVKP